MWCREDYHHRSQNPRKKSSLNGWPITWRLRWIYKMRLSIQKTNNSPTLNCCSIIQRSMQIYKMDQMTLVALGNRRCLCFYRKRKYNDVIIFLLSDFLFHSTSVQASWLCVNYGQGSFVLCSSIANDKDSDSYQLINYMLEGLSATVEVSYRNQRWPVSGKLYAKGHHPQKALSSSLKSFTLCLSERVEGLRCSFNSFGSHLCLLHHFPGTYLFASVPFP